MPMFQRMEAIENFSTSSTNKNNEAYSDTVVVDALPYIDLGYDEPGVREAALALVEEETRRYRPTKNYLEQVSLETFKLLRSENRQILPLICIQTIIF